MPETIGTVYVVRVVESTDSATLFDIRFMEETYKFAEMMMNPFHEIMVLRHVVNNLWKTHQYNQEYISFLLGTYSKEEFMTKAEAFLAQSEDMTPDQLSYSANLLVTVLQQPLNSSELSVLLSVDPHTLETVHLPLLEYNPENADQ